ncbi:hypothetical protein PIB30_019565 [Stylosanthes scabra]|uniref:Uncharacterized protein n=1 Tax=Stylosanthes scabra TaxID=79078 RepID=A0ABU6X8E9_9FABA|nr:hypothetical protein [Stylosanthes scabra]
MKAKDKVRADVIQNNTSRSGAWDTKAKLTQRSEMMLRQWRLRHKSENTNVNQSKEIESSWDAKKPVENSSLGLFVPSGMCVSNSHRQPLTGSSSMEDAASTALHADVETTTQPPNPIFDVPPPASSLLHRRRPCTVFPVSSLSTVFVNAFHESHPPSWHFTIRVPPGYLHQRFVLFVGVEKSMRKAKKNIGSKDGLEKESEDHSAEFS